MSKPSEKKRLVLCIVGLTQDLLAYMPKLAKWTSNQQMATLNPPLPAVTCTSQSTMITGKMPNAHGIVGNGWYFKDLAEIGFWKQSNHLVEAPKVWEILKQEDPDFTVAKMFWWYNMYAKVDFAVTPRPVYPADGRKIPSIYTQPPELKAEFQSKLGTFPLFNFWGPTASIVSSQWIAKATLELMRKESPNLALCYLPHLDYDLQKFGRANPALIQKACTEIDDLSMQMIEEAQDMGYDLIIVSEYGIEDVSHVIDINRMLRKAGYLKVQLVDTGWELLDAGASQAFAAADHQIAHVYVEDEQIIPKLKDLLSKVEGIELILDKDQQKAYQIEHARSGDLVLVAEKGAWFSYYYWLDESKRPDFATSVDIHRKPGYDPAELFIDPKILFPKLKVISKLALKFLGFRYYMDLIATNGQQVKGSHGRTPTSKSLGPVIISNLPLFKNDEHLEMKTVFDLILKSFH
jgi:predicted AlkP superfamily pyrophosphatase or phosphodiesterase